MSSLIAVNATKTNLLKIIPLVAEAYDCGYNLAEFDGTIYCESISLPNGSVRNEKRMNEILTEAGLL